MYTTLIFNRHIFFSLLMHFRTGLGLGLGVRIWDQVRKCIRDIFSSGHISVVHLYRYTKLLKFSENQLTVDQKTKRPAVVVLVPAGCSEMTR